jgi:Sulfotransferase domain
VKLFGVGAHRTGTTSLAEALTILGIPTSQWAHHEQIMADVRAGNHRLRLMETYDAVLDFPIPVLYRELDEAFPGSRFILTVRDEREWLASAEQHTRGRSLLPEEVMFYGTDTFNRDDALERYREHNRRVIEYFAGRPDLLVLDVCAGEGWDRLAPFCERPVPAVPFPWTRVVIDPPGAS